MAKTFLLDTNVLLDYADVDRTGHQCAFDFIVEALGQGARLLVTPCSFKDLYYCTCLAEKRSLRAMGVDIDEAASAQINEAAFSLVDTVTSFVTTLSNAPNDPRIALKLKGSHFDFEDNLLIAAAMHVAECILVTSDKQLLLHAPVPSMSPSAALANLRA